MNKVNEITEELKEMGSVLADMPRVMPYSVPDNFFENFENSLHEAISETSEAASNTDWGKSMPYEVPDNYFETLTESIVANSVHQEKSGTVPYGYFEQLPERMLALAKAEEARTKKAKIISLQGYRMFRQMKWVAAAALILGIGFGSYRLINSRHSDPEKMLSAVPSNDIREYLQQHIYRLDVDRVVSNSDINNLQLERGDIIQYLNDTGWD
jgi:hypothetical protein